MYISWYSFKRWPYKRPYFGEQGPGENNQAYPSTRGPAGWEINLAIAKNRGKLFPVDGSGSGGRNKWPANRVQKQSLAAPFASSLPSPFALRHPASALCRLTLLQRRPTNHPLSVPTPSTAPTTRTTPGRCCNTALHPTVWILNATHSWLAQLGTGRHCLTFRKGYVYATTSSARNSRLLLYIYSLPTFISSQFFKRHDVR